MQAALFGSKAFGIAGSLSLDVLESGSWAITVQVVGRKMLSPGLSCSLLWSKHRSLTVASLALYSIMKLLHRQKNTYYYIIMVVYSYYTYYVPILAITTIFFFGQKIKTLVDDIWCTDPFF